MARDRDDDGDELVAAGQTSTPVVATTTIAPASSPTVPPSPPQLPPVPADLQQRIDALPERLRNRALASYAGGALGLEQLEQLVTDYENRNPAVRVGSVIDKMDGQLTFEVYTTGEQVEVSIVEETLIRRAGAEVPLADLQPGELVMVVSTDEGTTALTIEAFGVSAP